MPVARETFRLAFEIPSNRLQLKPPLFIVSPSSDAPHGTARQAGDRCQTPAVDIREFNAGDEEHVVALWHACDLVRPWNDPGKDIQRKVAMRDGLFLVGVLEDYVVATVMAGYEGHRGWINYLAVRPDLQRCDLGRSLMGEAETRLAALGCPKINLQIRTSNLGAVAFYERLGYTLDEVISMGKRLESDGPAPDSSGPSGPSGSQLSLDAGA